MLQCGLTGSIFVFFDDQSGVLLPESLVEGFVLKLKFNIPV